MALGDDKMLTTEGIQRMCQVVLNETIVSYNSVLARITHITSQGQDVLKTGILYSNRTPEPHTIPVRLFKPRTRETIPDDYDTRRWVRDACAKMYKRTRGRATLSFGPSADDALEIFFCPFQQLSDSGNHDNYKNPHLSSLIEIEDSWYGNMVVLKTVCGDVVELHPSPEEMRVISNMIKE